MPRLLPALAGLFPARALQSDFADLTMRALHGPRPSAEIRAGARARLDNLRTAITR